MAVGHGDRPGNRSPAEPGFSWVMETVYGSEAATSNRVASGVSITEEFIGSSSACVATAAVKPLAPQIAGENRNTAFCRDAINRARTHLPRLESLHSRLWEEARRANINTTAPGTV